MNKTSFKNSYKMTIGDNFWFGFDGEVGCFYVLTKDSRLTEVETINEFIKSQNLERDWWTFVFKIKVMEETGVVPHDQN